MILILIVLSGCSTTSETDVIKIENTNQSPANLNNNNVSVNVPNVSATPIADNSAAAPPADNKPSTPVKERTPVVSSGGNDLGLFTQLRSALNSDPNLVNTVIIEVKDGNVTLTGNVADENQKSKAEQLIKDVKGIKSIKNNLRVSP